MEHHITSTDQWYTSLYAHMSSYAPNLYVGKYLTSDQYLGYMGTTGHSTGVHLHFELIPCRYLSGSCYSWNAYYNYAINQFKKGYKGPRGLITFPKGLYNSWNSR